MKRVHGSRHDAAGRPIFGSVEAAPVDFIGGNRDVAQPLPGFAAIARAFNRAELGVLNSQARDFDFIGSGFGRDFRRRAMFGSCGARAPSRNGNQEKCQEQSPALEKSVHEARSLAGKAL